MRSLTKKIIGWTTALGIALGVGYLVKSSNDYYDEIERSPYPFAQKIEQTEAKTNEPKKELYTIPAIKDSSKILTTKKPLNTQPITKFVEVDSLKTFNKYTSSPLVSTGWPTYSNLEPKLNPYPTEITSSDSTRITNYDPTKEMSKILGIITEPPQEITGFLCNPSIEQVENTREEYSYIQVRQISDNMDGQIPIEQPTDGQIEIEPLNYGDVEIATKPLPKTIIKRIEKSLSQTLLDGLRETGFTEVIGDNILNVLYGENKTLEKLAESNNISDPNKVYIGQEIKIDFAQILPEKYLKQKQEATTITYFQRNVANGNTLSEIIIDYCLDNNITPTTKDLYSKRGIVELIGEFNEEKGNIKNRECLYPNETVEIIPGIIKHYYDTKQRNLERQQYKSPNEGWQVIGKQAYKQDSNGRWRKKSASASGVPGIYVSNKEVAEAGLK